MKKQAIVTENAPGAVGPYSQAIKTGNLLFCSGQIGIDPATNKLVDGGVEAQAEQVFKNIKGLLAAAGAEMDDVVKATVFLKDMADFKKVNEIYARHFQPPFPARSAVAVRDLPLYVDIEIEVIAVL
ncbi:MAG: RidA family protein [bacterium]|nr:RidA family protein [bacterium]